MVNTSQQWYCQDWTYLTLVVLNKHLYSRLLLLPGTHHLLPTDASQQGHLFILEPAHHSHFIIHRVFSLSGPNNLALSSSMNTCCLTYAFLSTSLLPTNASQQGCLVILEPAHHSHRLRLYHEHYVYSPIHFSGASTLPCARPVWSQTTISRVTQRQTVTVNNDFAHFGHRVGPGWARHVTFWQWLNKSIFREHA